MNPLVYAEVNVHFERIEDLDSVALTRDLPEHGLERSDTFHVRTLAGD